MDNFIAHILVVDDDDGIRSLVKKYLNENNYLVTTANSAEDAVKKVKIIQFDLIILDIMMPGKDGYDVCRKIREQGNTLPIVFLTAMDREFDEVKGLEVGADDYVRKPFSPKMLIARINAIFRRIDQINSKGTNVSFGELEINTSTYIAQLDGEELHLPRKEFELLAFFMSQPNIIFNRDELLGRIWEKDVFVVDRTIDVHINRIRSKLGPCKNWIETVKGIGYRFRPKI